MKTRKDYLSGKCSHREYYAQFVSEEVVNTVIRSIGIDAIKASEKEHFNDIPLYKWDAINCPINSSLLKEAGEWLTLAVKNCVLKEAAKQIKEQYKPFKNMKDENNRLNTRDQIKRK